VGALEILVEKSPDPDGAYGFWGNYKPFGRMDDGQYMWKDDI
jgi:hypothetical protein